MPIVSNAARVFDYVVVGGGTAGCVLAARLAEDPDVSVALIEAGGPPRRVLDVPLLGLWAWLKFPRRYCFQDLTVPQPALGGRRVNWPAGRLIGGSSAVNAMIYNRGHRASYDRWSNVAGPMWTYEALLPYFKRAEDRERGLSQWHGVDGPVAVSESRHLIELAGAFVAGCHEVGIPATDDFSGAQPEGAGYCQLTQRAGRRSSAAEYLERTPGGPRVSVHLRTSVTRLTFERDRATGVEARVGGATVFIRARQEVVLCAGTLRSAQILLLSGIGAADALGRLDIPVVADRPSVGANLQDHVRVPVLRAFGGANPTSPGRLARAGVEYALARRGLLTSNVCDAAAIVRLDADAAVPQVRIIPHWRAPSQGHRAAVDFEVGLIDPRSQGRLTLTSRDPESPVAVDPGYLSAPQDAAILARGIALARAIGDSQPCRRAGVGDEMQPGAGDVGEYLRDHADTAFHPVGTCRLGMDPDAVVDTELRVIGVSGLRVADASVMPTTVAGHAQAAVMAIAERAADLIAARPARRQMVAGGAGSAGTSVAGGAT